MLTSSKNKQTDCDYPCLKVSKTTGAIVLFTECRVGTLVFKGAEFAALGTVKIDWNEEAVFKPYYGSVTIHNQ